MHNALFSSDSLREQPNKQATDGSTEHRAIVELQAMIDQTGIDRRGQEIVAQINPHTAHARTLPIAVNLLAPGGRRRLVA